jgi:Spy/CpxP family protein refolding chaperone
MTRAIESISKPINWMAGLALPVLALTLAMAPPAAAEPPDAVVLAQAGETAQVADAQPGVRSPMPGRRGDMRGEGQRWQRHGRHHRMPSLAAIALRHRAELGLNPQQVESLQKLQMDARRAGIQRRANVQLAALDLGGLLRSEPVDMAKVEAKVREIEKLRADGRLAFIRANEQGKAQLTADQRDKLKALREARWQQRMRRGAEEPGGPASAEVDRS